jgi:hypothetical protein
VGSHRAALHLSKPSRNEACNSSPCARSLCELLKAANSHILSEEK